MGYSIQNKELYLKDYPRGGCSNYFKRRIIYIL